jgi:hypothetical protein
MATDELDAPTSDQIRQPRIECMPVRNATRVWGVVMAGVIVGWGAGYLIWAPESPDEYGSYFDVCDPALTLLVGLPLAVTSGFLLSREGRVHLVGYAMLALTTISLAYLAQFSFFGGFCLDPEDVCVTTWPSRLAALGTAVLCVGAGWFVHRIASRSRGADTRTG